MFILTILVITLGLYLWSLTGLLQNYRRARKIGPPILVTPIPVRNPVWRLSESYIEPILKRSPFGLTNFLRYSTRGWTFHDKYYLHAKYGAAFIVVRPDVIGEVR